MAVKAMSGCRATLLILAKAASRRNAQGAIKRGNALASSPSADLIDRRDDDYEKKEEDNDYHRD